MGDIEWTDRTWNPVVGCARVSPGCEHCYAETMAARQVSMSAGSGRESVYLPVVDVERRRWNRRAVFLPERLGEPLRWRKPCRVFVNSMSDLFHEDITFEQIAAVFGVMAATPRLTYQVLTKRPARMLEFFAWLDTGIGDPVRRGSSACAGAAWSAFKEQSVVDPTSARQHEANAGHVYQWWMQVSRWPLHNAWLGVSVEDQQRANERIPLLLQVPAAVRFLSIEPLVGAVDINPYLWLSGASTAGPWLDHTGRRRGGAGGVAGQMISQKPSGDIAWVIVGGESGPGARPCEVDWIRSIVAQCSTAGALCFVKQMGASPVDRNDAGYNGDDEDGWPAGVEAGKPTKDLGGFEYQGKLVRVRLTDRKGGNMAEWPPDLQVRQMPEVQPCA